MDNRRHTKRHTREEIFGVIVLVITILFIGVWFFSSRYITWTHEEVHKQINKYYGVDSRIEYYDLGLLGKTIPLLNQTIKGNKDTYYKLHSENEIYGYYIDIVITTILFIGYFLSLLLLLDIFRKRGNL